MDMLDPLGSSTGKQLRQLQLRASGSGGLTAAVNSKVLVHEIGTETETDSETDTATGTGTVRGKYSAPALAPGNSCKIAMESDDEQNVVDHLSPQTLLETPADDMHYSLRSPDGIVTYGVLKVEEAVESVPQIVTSPNNFSNSGVQVLTGNLNGQLYVISNPNDVFSSQSGGRTIAPRSSLVDQNSAILPNNRKRDERRRATHNEVERRRRDKINNWISKLAKIIPEGSPSDMKGNGHYDGQSKGGILAKACQYIADLRESEKNMELYMKENKQLTLNIEVLKQKNAALEQENKALKDMLKRSGIEMPEHKMNVNVQME